MAEEIKFAKSDPNAQVWKAQNYTAREWNEPKFPGDTGSPRPIKKWTDPRKEAEDYRNNYERTFGHK